MGGYSLGLGLFLLYHRSGFHFPPWTWLHCYPEAPIPSSILPLKGSFIESPSASLWVESRSLNLWDCTGCSFSDPFSFIHFSPIPRVSMTLSKTWSLLEILVSWTYFSRKHGEGFFRWVHLSCSHESHYKVSLQGIIIMKVISRSHCKESLQGVIARSHCKESLQGVIARSHRKELLQGVIARSHCKESLQGVVARSNCKES